jgi:hypothetical protein
MREIQVAFIRDSVPIYAGDILSLDPTVLQFQGGDFQGAIAIHYGEFEITDIVVDSPTSMRVTLPDEVANSDPPSEISVISHTFTTTPTSYVDLRLDRVGQFTEGAHRLLQQFLVVLFTTPGTCLFRPNEGGGMLQIIQTPRASNHRDQLIAAITRAVSSTAEQVRSNYIGRSVPLSERLSSARVTKNRWGAKGSLHVTIEVINAAGRGASANVGL